MGCDKNGRKRTLPAAASGRGLKRKCGACCEGVLRLAVAAAVPCASAERPMRVDLVPPCPTTLPVALHSADYPFMNNMDEISYWVYTKRAPCLFNYDNIIKKQGDQAHCSNTQVASIKSKTEEEPTPKKKRKLKLLDEGSVTTEKQQNVYFKATKDEKIVITSCKSEDLESDMDFNIKNRSAQKKLKKVKQKTNHASTHKKNKIMTSTPKVVHLRRSLRKAQQNINNNSHINSSFEIFNSSSVNGKQNVIQVLEAETPENIVNTERNKSKVMLPEKTNNEIVLNGQFEDMSDVSGFTANYIRSTKLYPTKTPQKLRNQNRTLIKPTKQRVQTDKLIMCLHKSVNTGFPNTATQNCSRDSSQNALNVVTVKHNERSTRVNKSTSMLKFMDSNLEANLSNDNITQQESKNNLNISFQSRSSGASRYPRRHKNNVTTPEQNFTSNTKANSRKNTGKGKHNLNRKENSEEKVISKTRSGRRIGLNQSSDLEESSMLKLNDSTEQMNSSLAINVANPSRRNPKRISSSRCLRSKICKNKSKDSDSGGSNENSAGDRHCALEQSTSKHGRRVKKSVGKSLERDKLRDKSGFTACFSDTDSDSEPLKRNTFFC